jgi:hypothetical protein
MCCMFVGVFCLTGKMEYANSLLPTVSIKLHPNMQAVISPPLTL